MKTLFVVGTALALAACSFERDRKDCSDFSCQQDAQEWHERHPEDRLDGDGNGIACEHLPNCIALGAHQHHALPQLCASQLRERVVDGVRAVDGRYRAMQIETGCRLDFLLQERRVGEARNVTGVVRWGDRPDERGQIVRGEVLGGVAWLEIVPDYTSLAGADADEDPGLGYAAFIDLVAFTGAIARVGRDPAPEHCGAFTVVERLGLIPTVR